MEGGLTAGDDVVARAALVAVEAHHRDAVVALFELAKARRRGFADWRRRLEPPRENTTLRIKLVRRPKAHGRLTINSIPWATVFLDGTEVGTTPIRGLKVAAGRHRVVLKDGRGRVLQSFVTRVAKNRTRVHSFDHNRQGAPRR